MAEREILFLQTLLKRTDVSKYKEWISKSWIAMNRFCISPIDNVSLRYAPLFYGVDCICSETSLSQTRKK